MKTFIMTGVLVILLALDWAALHDILKGEPDPWAEYAMVVLSVVSIGALLYEVLRRQIPPAR